MTDDAVADPDDQSTAVGSIVRAFREAASAAVLAGTWLQQWVQRRGRLTQLGVGGLVAVVVERILGTVIAVLTTISFEVVLPSESELLTVLVVIIGGQTVLQIRKLFHIDGRLETMEETTTLPDGGEETPRRDGNVRRTYDEGSTGVVGAVGVISGIVIAAPHGVGAAIFAAVLGWILGDEFEQRVLIPPEFR